MSMRRSIRLALLVTIMGGTVSGMLRSSPPAAKEAANEVRVADFALVDVRTDKQITLAQQGDHPVVLAFLSTVCPVNNAYLFRLNELQKEYAAKGVKFIGINSNYADSLALVKAHARDNAMSFPIVRDVDQKIADALDVIRIPEVFVLDAQRVIRYRGRIDDQYSIEGKKLKATTRELADAIEAVIAGKSPTIAQTEISGCIISRAPKPKPDAVVTYSKHIAPLMQKYCQECHRPGQIGPMPFLTYEQVSGWGEMVSEVVTERRMPPWYADPAHGKFKNDRSMASAEIELVKQWVEQGCARGNPQHEPAALQFPDTWQIGKPDRIITMNEAYAVPADMPKWGVPYQIFVMDPGFTEDVWVQKAEARPGAPEVVHHILTFIAPPLDKVDPNVPDFPFLPGVKNARVLCGSAPGDMPMIYPEGVAIKIPAGSQLIFQLHYTPNGKAAIDRSSIGLVFSKTKPERQVLTVPIFNQRVRIPPGDDNYAMDSYFTLKHDAKILSFMPHMHVRGKDFKINLRTPDGKETTHLNVPKYNFNWQNVYRYAEPLAARKGTVIHCIAHYDNSSKNLMNPDPTKLVGWGDQTWAEMMIGWMDMVYDIPVN